MIDWDIHAPTMYSFLLRYNKAGQLSTPAFTIALCIAERCLLEYDLIVFPPSLIATTIVSMARKYSISPSRSGNSTPFSPYANSPSTSFFSTTFWNATMQHYSGYTQDEILPCFLKIQSILRQETLNRARIFTCKILKENENIVRDSLSPNTPASTASSSPSQYMTLLHLLNNEVNLLQEDLNYLNQGHKVDEIIQVLSDKTSVNLNDKTPHEKKNIISDMKRKKIGRQDYLTVLPGILEYCASKSEKYERLIASQTQWLQQQEIILSELSHQSLNDDELYCSQEIVRSASGPVGRSLSSMGSPTPVMMMMASEDTQLSGTTDRSQSFENQQQFHQSLANAQKQRLPLISERPEISEEHLHDVIDDFISSVSDVPVIYESVRAKFQKVYTKLVTCPP